MASRALPAIEPEELLSELLGLDPGLRRQVYDGERSMFYDTERYASLKPLLVESLEVVKAKWAKTKRTAG